MKRYYLIDFENVADGGLEGFFDLCEDDTVYIFYTPKSAKIGIDFFEAMQTKSCPTNLVFQKVSSGSQALDFQLSSFLGALIATHSGEENEFYIVSKDKGYCCLTGFWASRTPSASVTRVHSIADAPMQPRPIKAEESAAIPEPVQEEPQPVQAEKPAEKTQSKRSSRSRRRTKAPVEQASAFEKPASEPAEPKPEEPVTEEKPAQGKPAESVAAKTAEAPAKPAEPAAKQTAVAQSAQPSAASADRSALNTAVQQTLSKAKYDNTVISFVASLAAKNCGPGKSKQTVYRGIIAKFGQKKGLEIYNTIKSLL